MTDTRRPGPRIDLGLFGLEFTSAKDDPVMPLIKALPKRTWTGPGIGDEPPRVWLIAVAPENLPGLRRIYKTGAVAFSPAAIAALQRLSGPRGDGEGPGPAPPPSAPQEASGPHGVEIAPEVCANLRGLPPSTDPSDAAARGGDGRGPAAPTSNALPPAMARVSSVVAPDNSVHRRSPTGGILPERAPTRVRLTHPQCSTK